jgi:hypothetical protein
VSRPSITLDTTVRELIGAAYYDSMDVEPQDLDSPMALMGIVALLADASVGHRVGVHKKGTGEQLARVALMLAARAVKLDGAA